MDDVDLEDLDDIDADLEAEMEKFLKQQDTVERGFDPKANEGKLLGADEVGEEEAKAYCRDVVRILRLLKEKRDMPVREAKLVIQIEDPSRDEARKMGVEDARGVSRDEMGVALEEVAAGKLPADRIALRALHAEMVTWPFLDSENKATGPKEVEAKPALSPDGMVDESDDNAAQQQDRDVPGWRPGQARPPVGRDPLEPKRGLVDRLPDWMGYGTLYAVSAVPVVIVIVVVYILFTSSLR